jgi:hypothetical protein
MTRFLYAEAARRVVVHGCLLVSLFSGVLLLLALAVAWYGPPALQPLREAARQQGQGEALAGLLGLLGGLVLAPLPFLLVLPLALYDRRYGLRCPRCRRSVTLGCPQRQVLRSGQCTRCGAVLFESADTVGAA